LFVDAAAVSAATPVRGQVRIIARTDAYVLTTVVVVVAKAVVQLGYAAALIFTAGSVDDTTVDRSRACIDQYTARFDIAGVGGAK
jgi:hypothetical protein